MPSADNIILIGFSGTGKTLVGEGIARLLGWQFVDTDAEVEGKVGKSVGRIFAEDGEESFRRMERCALRDACSGRLKVIATGGGAAIDPLNRELMLSQGFVVCLDASPKTIYGRLTGDYPNPEATRPLLGGDDPLERIRALKHSRQGYYSEAHRIVQTDGLTVEQTAQIVVEACQFFLPSSTKDGRRKLKD